MGMLSDFILCATKKRWLLTSDLSKSPRHGLACCFPQHLLHSSVSVLRSTLGSCAGKIRGFLQPLESMVYQKLHRGTQGIL